MLKDWEWKRSLQCLWDLTDLIALISLSLICHPLHHLDRSVWKDTVSENSISNDTSLKKYMVRSFSQFKSTQEKRRYRRKEFGRKFLIFLISGLHQMVNTEIRLIVFFAAKDGEALYNQQKQDWELTVAHIMNSLLPNSDLNWIK